MVWQEGKHIPAGSKVFVGSTMELFGDWIEPEWMKVIFEYCESLPKITFIFLTKQPQNLLKWSPFPDNFWVGVSATDYSSFANACNNLENIKAKVKFLSIEPLLDWSFNWEKSYLSNLLKRCHCSWIAIGRQTPASKKTAPQVEWIADIVRAANTAKIPVFLKENLDSMLHYQWQDNVWGKLFRTQDGKLRQELPRV
jgi:protein gp37